MEQLFRVYGGTNDYQVDRDSADNGFSFRQIGSLLHNIPGRFQHWAPIGKQLVLARDAKELFRAVASGSALFHNPHAPLHERRHERPGIVVLDYQQSPPYVTSPLP